jgi:hypothetical protein
MTLSNPINMETFENAIHSWFSDSIESTVIWSYQSAPRPKYPFGSLEIIAGPIAASPARENRTTTDLGRDPGEEIEIETTVPCTITVRGQAYVNLTDSREPQYNAMNLVTRAQSRLHLPSVQQDFYDANISVINDNGVENISEVLNDAFVSRAALTVAFGATLSLSEFTGYIKTVQIISTDLGIDQIFGDI